MARNLSSNARGAEVSWGTWGTIKRRAPTQRPHNSPPFGGGDYFWFILGFLIGDTDGGGDPSTADSQIVFSLNSATNNPFGLDEPLNAQPPTVETGDGAAKER